VSGPEIQLYFDFISPYSYLACQLVATRPEYRDLRLVYRPVVFGTMLSRLGAKGPGEIPARRRQGLQDILLLAQLYDLPLAGPPTHPFNSLYALRSVLAAPREKQGALTTAYFAAAWGRGESLEDMAVLRRCLAEVGVEQDPEAAASDRVHRAALKANTAELLERGGWGVPSFGLGHPDGPPRAGPLGTSLASGPAAQRSLEDPDGLLLFGHDRLPLLLAYVEGRVRQDPALLEALLARPQPGRIT
jgi:2-hydroxychromene-2-carboxylate isomerase